MLSQFTDLIAATAAFVLGHLMLSSQPLRAPLIERLGEKGFRAFYSVFVLAAFAWMLLAYRGAPIVDLWIPPAWARWVAVAFMPLAALLVVGGLTTPSATLVGGDKAMDRATRPVQGFLTISRHCFLSGTALWAILHLQANGDAATTILSGGILVLSVAGMWHIDRRREASMGADWGPIRLTTSRLPFLAVLQRRTGIDWRGIGWWRPLLALALYAALLFTHRHIAGVPVLY